MAWLLIFVAGLFEVAWALAMKASAGFTRLGPSLLTLGAMAVSVLLLAWGLRSLPVGTAYAVWTGVGAAGTAIMGILIFGEPATLARLFFVGLIVAASRASIDRGGRLRTPASPPAPRPLAPPLPAAQLARRPLHELLHLPS